MATAATITYTLTGGAAEPCPSCVDPPLEAYEVNLEPVVPGFTLSVGDTINGTVTLSTPLTVPAGAGFNGVTLLLAAPGPGYTVNYTDRISFYDNGEPVSPPGQWGDIQGPTGALILGASSSGPSAAFTFDKLTFDSTIAGLLDPNNNSINSVNLGITVPSLDAVVDPVPLPATAWLLLSGIAALGVSARTRAC
jgi:hypothetical protein